MEHFIFRLPDIGEGIVEAEIVALYVKVGDFVEEDAAIADVMTDKATIEITAPVSGKITEIGGSPGDRIAIGSILVVFQLNFEGADRELPVTANNEEPSINLESDPALPELAQKTSAHRGEEDRSCEAISSRLEPGSNRLPLPLFPSTSTHVLASPAVRARAMALGIDLSDVRAFGGRVRHADLDVFITYNGREGFRPAGVARPDETIQVIGMRRRIAENVGASKRHIPHFTYIEEIEVTKLEEMRADLNKTRGAKPKLTMLPLLIVAIVKTLPDFPMINARYDDEAGVVTRHGSVHIGMATQTDAGLMVPVIRDAQAKNIWQLASEIGRLAEVARSSKVKSDELSGSTITITSLGPLGGIATTPVINRPEVAIIGPNKIVERPVFDGDDIRRAKLMNLSMSCDHRVIDGWDAASFVQALKKLLETPVLILMEPDA